MDPEPDVIHRQIDQTRESLTEKLETLEDQVKQTVDTVKSKVEDTVDAVTAKVQDTVATVKRTFDIPYQVRQHPYGMTGGALLTGAALGWFLGGQHRTPQHRSYPAQRAPAYRAIGDGLEPRRPAESRPSFLGGLLEPVAAELDKIKATAIGALMGMARDAVRRSVPPALAERVDQIMNDITRRAGGDPITGPVLPERSGENASAEPTETHL